ncbi:MAG: NAD(P)H-dependent oxidoreductase [Desulfovibrio sp.]|jgi:NAD(P)H-dependent FMN reductase|nr:NAD(P)H-dependent oxidoreductase [Desulfovibrio sp.]
MLILQCSPRAGGVSDAVADIFASGAARAGANIRRVPLREYAVPPCAGCRACAAPPHNCLLARDGIADQAEKIFALLRSSSAIFLAAPIYFYALPAHCKALIDRSQRFWAARERGSLPSMGHIPLLAALTASRKRGRRLFTGAALTLAYFARALGLTLEKPILLRGLDEPGDLLRRKTLCRNIEILGSRWGTLSTSCSRPG